MSVEPSSVPVRITALHPTQITVGMHEVELKTVEVQAHLKKHDPAQWLGLHQVPGVIGPKGVFYLIDHHHLCLSLLRCGQDQVMTRIEADLSHIDEGRFWNFLDARGWSHPCDETGRRRRFEKIPHKVIKLVDDRYRSLAGLVRNAGGYAKNDAPFSEFLWADYFRTVPGLNNWSKWDELTRIGVHYARHKNAKYLPGWCGTH